MNRIITYTAICALALVTSCKSTHTPVSDTYATASMRTQCLVNNNDGTIQLKVWGNGVNLASAIDNALRNAVNQILFESISVGPGLRGTTIFPLVSEPNAREKFSNFFNHFFASGEYGKYAYNASKSGDIQTSKSQGRNGAGIVVVVNRAALKQALIEEGILEP